MPSVRSFVQDGRILRLWEPHSDMRTRKSERTLVERFDLDNRRAVVAADPKRAGVLRIVDIDAADVGRARQHVFRILAALDIQTRHTVGRHGPGPRLTVTVE